jgi:hypothetical protein
MQMPIRVINIPSHPNEIGKIFKIEKVAVKAITVICLIDSSFSVLNSSETGLCCHLSSQGGSVSAPSLHFFDLIPHTH